MSETSALAALRALRNQILAKLEQSEDFRVLRGIEFVLAKETRLPQGHQFPQGQTAQPGARAVQDGLAASIGTPPPYSVMAADEPSLSFPNGQVDQSKPVDFPQVRTAS
jgi:hypothetical protein